MVGYVKVPAHENEPKASIHTWSGGLHPVRSAEPACGNGQRGSQCEAPPCSSLPGVSQQGHSPTPPPGGVVVVWAPCNTPMGRAEVAAVVQHVLQQCGASCLIDIADLIEDDDGRAHILSVLRSDACRAAAAQAPVNTKAVNVTLQVTVPLAPPPPPPTATAAVQVAFAAVPTATVGIATDNSVRNAKVQTARSLYGTATAVQTDSTMHMVDGFTTTESAIGMVDASTDHYLDRVWLGLVHSAVQTEVIGAVVAATDHEQLGAELAASVEAVSAASDRAAAAVDREVQTEADVVLASEYEQLGAQLEALSSRAANLSAQAAEAERKAAEDRTAAAVDRAVAAADREAAAKDRDKHAGVIALQRARLQRREHDWSTS